MHKCLDKIRLVGLTISIRLEQAFLCKNTSKFILFACLSQKLNIQNIFSDDNANGKDLLFITETFYHKNK